MSSTNDLSPGFDHPSTDSALSGPARVADSYFPSSHRSSFSSNSSFSIAAEPRSSTTLRVQRPEPPAQPARAQITAGPALSAAPSTQAGHKLDALSRQFPKPEHESTVEELLARPPQKWSVSHYVKNAREARVPVQDKEQQAREFAQAKRELLGARAALDTAAGGRR